MARLPKELKLRRFDKSKVCTANIIRLTPDVARDKIDASWWTGLNIRKGASSPEDAHWPWYQLVQNYSGLRDVDCVALELTDGSIHGAMIIAFRGDSQIELGKKSVEVSRIATCPTSRKNLVVDPLFIGIGKELIAWACYQSDDIGWDGRIILNSLPNAVTWYQQAGFHLTGRVDREGLVEYELPSHAACGLLKNRGYF